MAMHRADHIAIAKAIRDADLNNTDIHEVAIRLAKVCAERTPKTATFDRGLFLAYALSPNLPEGE